MIKIKWLLTFLSLISSISYAGLPPTSIKGQLDAAKSTAFNFQTPNYQSTKTNAVDVLLETGNDNLVADPGFEASATTLWAASGGTYTKTSTAANVGDGLKALSWDSNSASQTLSSTASAIPPYLYGQNGFARMALKCASGTCTHKLQVYDGTTVIGETVISSSASFVYSNVNFIYPSSGNIILRLISVASDEPLIYGDKAFVGPALNVQQISQAQYLGKITYAFATSCIWSVTPGTTFTSYSADTDCSTPSVTGQVTAPATKIPGIVLANYTPGYYLMIAKGTFEHGGTSASIGWRFTDGTNNSDWAGGVENTGNGGGILSSVIENTTITGSATIQLQAIGGAGATAVIDNYNVQHGFTIEVYRFPSISENAIRNPVVYYQTYSARVAADGTVSGENTNFINGNCSVATSDFTCTWNSGIFTTAPNCIGTTFNPGLSGPVITIRTEATTASVLFRTVDLSGSNVAAPFEMLCQSTTAVGQPAPVLVGGVVQPSAGAESFVRLQGTCSSSATVSSNLSGTTIGNISSGACVITLPANFSATPVCVDAVNAATLGALNSYATTATSATSVTVYGRDVTAGLTTFGYSALCMGPK